IIIVNVAYFVIRWRVSQPASRNRQDLLKYKYIAVGNPSVQAVAHAHIAPVGLRLAFSVIYGEGVALKRLTDQRAAFFWLFQYRSLLRYHDCPAVAAGNILGVKAGSDNKQGQC